MFGKKRVLILVISTSEQYREQKLSVLAASSKALPSPPNSLALASPPNPWALPSPVQSLAHCRIPTTFFPLYIYPLKRPFPARTAALATSLTFNSSHSFSSHLIPSLLYSFPFSRQQDPPFFLSRFPSAMKRIFANSNGKPRNKKKNVEKNLFKNSS